MYKGKGIEEHFIPPPSPQTKKTQVNLLLLAV